MSNPVTRDTSVTVRVDRRVRPSVSRRKGAVASVTFVVVAEIHALSITTLLTCGFATEAEADAAMTRILAERPFVRS